jgi:AAHS family 4-hydroxybenzoate transporter-like MFS transporter
MAVMQPSTIGDPSIGPTEATGTRRAPWLATLIGVAIIMADGFDLQSIGFVAPEIARDWGLPLADFAIVFSLGLAGTIPGAMFAGSLSRMIGHRLAIMLALLLFGAASLATAAATSIVGLAILRFITGIGLGAAVPLVIVTVAGAAPVRFRATFITLILCGQPLGAILGAALCARLIPIHGWEAAFLLGGALPLLLIPAALALPEPKASREEVRLSGDASKGMARELLRPDLKTTSIFLWITAFLNVMVLYIIVNWLPGTIRTEGHALDQSLVAISLFNFGGIGGILLMGVLIDRLGLFRIVPLAFFVGAMSIIGLDLFRFSLPALYAASLFAGVAGYGAGASIGAMAVLLYPAPLQTMATGWALAIGRIGAAAGPLAAGLALRAGLAPPHLFLIAGGAAALAGLCVLMLGRQRLQASPQGSGL